MKVFERKGISPGTLYLSKGRAHLQQRLQGTLRCSAFIPWGPGYGLTGPPQDLVHLCLLQRAASGPLELPPTPAPQALLGPIPVSAPPCSLASSGRESFKCPPASPSSSLVPPHTLGHTIPAFRTARPWPCFSTHAPFLGDLGYTQSRCLSSWSSVQCSS